MKITWSPSALARIVAASLLSTGCALALTAAPVLANGPGDFGTTGRFSWGATAKEVHATWTPDTGIIAWSAGIEVYAHKACGSSYTTTWTSPEIDSSALHNDVSLEYYEGVQTSPDNAWHGMGPVWDISSRVAWPGYLPGGQQPWEHIVNYTPGGTHDYQGAIASWIEDSDSPFYDPTGSTDTIMLDQRVSCP